MAHVVGVPRRDPCQKCQLPVFLAERLTVGKKIYHRTCLKCARCNSQLTPGSFYETEVDDEYCCETCPDEEEVGDDVAGANTVTLRRFSEAETHRTSDAISEETAETVSKVPTTPVRTVRSSIADRLAFFEQNKSGDAASSGNSKLLQKSVTDEEKRKSLKQFEETNKTAQFKMNKAFNSFMQDTIDGDEAIASQNKVADDDNDDEEDGSTATSTTENKSITQMETSDTEDSVETALPELPKTEVPPGDFIRQDLDGTATTQQSKRFTATAQLQLATKQDDEEATSKHDLEGVKETSVITAVPLPQERKKTEMQLNLMTSKDNENNNRNNDVDKHTSEDAKEVHDLKQNSIEINLDISQSTNDNVCVTKETIADDSKVELARHSDVVKRTQLDNDNVVVVPKSNTVDSNGAYDRNVDSMDAESSIEMRVKSTAQTTEHNAAEDVATTERLSVVRARLQQFEVIANNYNNNNHSSAEQDNNSHSHNEKDNLSANDAINKASLAANKCSNTSPQNEEIKTTPNDTNELGGEAKNEDATIDTDCETDITEETAKVETILHDTITHQEIQSKAVEMQETNNRKSEVENINNVTESLIEVPLNEQKEKEDDNENKASKYETKMKHKENISVEPMQAEVNERQESSTGYTQMKQTENIQYPEDLNPFKSDDDDDNDNDDNMDNNKENINATAAYKQQQQHPTSRTPQPRVSLNTSTNSSNKMTATTPKTQNLNPFDSSDDEIELEKSTNATTPTAKVPPPRPPPPRISRNPFGEDEHEDSNNFSRRSSLSSSLTKKTPVPTPRSNLSQSQNPTPEPTPRLSQKTITPLRNASSQSSNVLQNSNGDYYGSANSLSATTTPQHLQRNSDLRGSNNSLTSSSGGTMRSRKNRKAPAPPAPPITTTTTTTVKELFPSTETIGSSKTSTPSSSTVGSPKMNRKKRPAPAPPKPARLEPHLLSQVAMEHDDEHTLSKNLHSYPLQSDLDSKLSDEEKALLEGKQQQLLQSHEKQLTDVERRNLRKVIPLDISILEDEHAESDDIKHKLQPTHEVDESNVVYRRMIIPPTLDTPAHERNSFNDFADIMSTHDRQLEKLKDNKEAKNRNRQSQISASSGAEDSDATTFYNKSSHGKWKRRKGPAPALPIPPRRVLQMLPLQEIRHELDIIEVQQQGLEKQGVILEKMIRDRCEGQNGEPLAAESGASTGGDAVDNSVSGKAAKNETVQNSKEVEDLILQLFELVNEKNELFRRQAELMYLRRQHRLEQEQADLEYEIRVLMAQPERNKTDTDKAREEALIARLVEVVQLRNEVVECLEMDRLREAEEDLSIKQSLEMHTIKREESQSDDGKKSIGKLSKKEKKKQKETKKLLKSKKLDADKDADETELHADKQKSKKKKKKLLIF